MFPIRNDDDHRLAGGAADARLQDLSWPPDLVWLGMGEDGHTASIFPGPDLQDALDAPKARRAVGVLPDPMPDEAPVARVTLTRASILAARTLLITITGAEKKAVQSRRAGRPQLPAPTAGCWPKPSSDRHPLGARRQSLDSSSACRGFFEEEKRSPARLR